MPAFLDPRKPLATCRCKSCEGCEVGSLVTCHFTGRQLAHFLAFMLPPFLLGGAGIVSVGPWWLAPWLGIVIGFFGFAEIRVMCAHCPHYAEPGFTLKCWANYGAPKLWRYRPGPMSRAENAVFFGGLALVTGYPLLFLLVAGQWFLLLVFAISTAGAAMTLTMFLCTRCMNFACPLNGVDEETRQAFRERNPAASRDRAP